MPTPADKQPRAGLGARRPGVLTAAPVPAPALVLLLAPGSWLLFASSAWEPPRDPKRTLSWLLVLVLVPSSSLGTPTQPKTSARAARRAGPQVLPSLTRRLLRDFSH